MSKCGYKKNLIFLLCIILMMIFLTGCGSYAEDNGKPTIVCTIFPEYDWILNILGDEAEQYNIKLILDGTADIHSYQPTAADIAAIASCDLLIYVGGESDSWVGDALKGSINENVRAVRLLDCLGNRALEEEFVEGMQQGVFESGHQHDVNTSEDVEYDEHVWLSLKNAEIFVRECTLAIEQLSPDKSSVFESNAENYIKELQNLDSKFSELVQQSSINKLMFADRFAFRYMTSDYGLEYYAAFSGCSADAEAGFETVVYLADKLNEEKLPAVIILENSDTRLAEIIIENAEESDVLILSIDSMQSVSETQRENGYSYLTAMEKNLKILQMALGHDSAS